MKNEKKGTIVQFIDRSNTFSPLSVFLDIRWRFREPKH